MKSNQKSKIINLILLGIIVALSPIITTNSINSIINSNSNSGYSDSVILDNENLKISTISGKIHIDGNSGWIDFRNAGNCTGQGTYSNSYVIEDLIIDGGGSGNCILIENSDVYFRIENCTVYNAEFSGIKLDKVENGTLIDNICSFNNYAGIRLSTDCYNNTISGNNANNNNDGIELFLCNNNTISGNTAINNTDGIYLWSSDNNTISGNTANNNDQGIYIWHSDNNNIMGNNANNNNRGIVLASSVDNVISGNIMNECGLEVSGPLQQLLPQNIDTTNLINGKPLYYYFNEINLGSNNFTNTGQVILVNCNDSLIDNLNISHTSTGISLHFCNNNTISGNNATNNIDGIYLWSSDNNTISGNIMDSNDDYGINLMYSDNNTLSGNIATNNKNSGIILQNNCTYNTLSDNTAINNHWGGIILLDSDNNIVLGSIANNNEVGISLSESNSNTVSENNASNNDYGIYLYHSDNNIISLNTLIDNEFSCIYQSYCNNNIIENNYCPIEDSTIPGYNLFFSFGILFVLSIIIMKKIRKSWKNNSKF
ncbi:MAG: NosD domain-containing protein [Candidatus Odinarchaeota archaeon]